MKVIVFGGSGFLGSHVCDKLSDAGHDVTIYDIEESFYRTPEQKIIIGDILDEEKVRQSVADKDVVLNFSGLSDIETNTQRPIDAVKTNVLGNSILLEAARSADIKRYVFASSAYVFSGSGIIYRSCKRACEDFIEDYQRAFGLEYTILRYGSLYGPRSDKKNSIYCYIEQAIEQRKIICNGHPDDIREYIHVEDAALMTLDILNPQYANQNIILTGKETFKVADFLNMISEISGGVDIEYRKIDSPFHYKITPYTFSPKIGKKLVNNLYTDIGQGLLQLMEDVFKEVNRKKLC